jgi:hypothetical protein
MDDFDWHRFLVQWSKLALKLGEESADLPSEVIASGWLGYPGATEQQIAEAEDRLGAVLPPSYRSFLKASNGWRLVDDFVDGFWPIEEVEWFAARNQEWIDAYSDPSEILPVSDEDYFVYGKDQDTAKFPNSYLQTMLEISPEGDSCIYLLNPKVITDTGEWEAWYLANWLPGARRYRSFQELMQAKYQALIAQMGHMAHPDC